MFKSILEIFRKAQRASLAVYTGKHKDAREIMLNGCKGRYY